MFPRSTVAALVSALTGCVGSPPKEPLVEYREGLTPITRPSPCEASYALRSATEPTAPPLAVVHVAEGKRVGFRRERNQSVTAIGPNLTLPLQPGAYVWEVVPGSVPPWKKRAKQELQQIARSIGVVSGTAALFGLAAMLDPDDDSPPKPGPGEPDGVIIPGHHDQKP